MTIIGSALIAVAPETKGFAAAVNSEVSGAMKGLSGTLTKVGSTLTTAVTAPLIGFAAVGVKSAIDVEKGLREVNTMFGLTGKAAEASFSQLQSGVAGLSKEVGIAQSTITSGLYQAISAGVPKENAFTFMQVASKAAIAGVTDVATSVNGLTTIINAFGLNASDAQAVADSMFTTVKGGKTNFAQLSDAMFQVAPAAAAAGVGFREVNAAISTLTSAGTPTAVATTQIRAALVGLQRPSDDMNKIFKKLGFTNAQTAIESKGLGFALEAVTKAAGGDAGKMQTLLGSVEAVAAANVLAGTGAGKFKEELEKQAKSTGAVNDAFDEMEKTTARKLDRMKVTVQNLAITLGNVLLPVVEKAAAFVSDLAAKFQGLSPEMRKVVGIAIAAAAALGPLLLITSKLITAGKDVAGALGSVGRGLGLLKNAEGARGGLAKLGPVFSSIGSAAQSVVSSIVRVGATVITTTAQVVAGAARQLAAYVVTAAGAVAGFVATAAAAVASAAAVVAAWLVAAAPFIALALVIAGVVLLIVKNWDTIKAATEAVWHAIVAVIQAVAAQIVAVITGWVAVIKGIFTFWATLAGIVGHAFAAMAGAVSSGVGTVVSFVAGLPGKIVGALGSLAGKLRQLGEDAFDSMWRGINSIIPKLLSLAAGLVSKLVSKLDPRHWFSTPEEHYRMLWGAGFGAIIDEGRKVIGPLAATTSKIIDAASFNGLAGLQDDAVRKYYAAVLQGGDYANDWITHVPEAMRQAVQQAGIDLAYATGGKRGTYGADYIASKGLRDPWAANTDGGAAVPLVVNVMLPDGTVLARAIIDDVAVAMAQREAGLS